MNAFITKLNLLFQGQLTEAVAVAGARGAPVGLRLVTSAALPAAPACCTWAAASACCEQATHHMLLQQCHSAVRQLMPAGPPSPPPTPPSAPTPLTPCMLCSCLLHGVLCPQTKEIAALLSSMGDDEEVGHGCGHAHGRGGARKARAAPLTSHTLEAIQDTIGELFAKVGAGSPGG